MAAGAVSGPLYGQCPTCLGTLTAGHVCPVAVLARAPAAPLEGMSELERARIDAQRNNTKVTPEQILRLALDDLRRGEVKADACLIYLIKKPAGDECGTRNVYRSNMDRPDEVAYLEYFKMRTLEDWRDS